jgi:hypothetical protein
VVIQPKQEVAANIVSERSAGQHVEEKKRPTWNNVAAAAPPKPQKQADLDPKVSEKKELK